MDNPLQLRAKAELELRRRRRERADYAALPMIDFVPAISPEFQRTPHLTPLGVQCDRIDNEEIRLACHTPPRHGKTEFLLHLIVRTLMRRPSARIGYATYSADLAQAKSNRARRRARNMGVDIVTDRADEWRTSAGGGLLARGVGGGWTGRGLDLLIVDDPFKDRKEAESPTVKKAIVDWYNDAAYTRLQPGASAIVNMARWAPDDLAGYLIKEHGYPYLRLPAICDSDDDPLGRAIGDALWPDLFPIPVLNDRMRNEYTAASLYQGRPRPRGESLFHDVWYYDGIPDQPYRVGNGLDLAYTATSFSDWSVMVSTMVIGDTYYVVDVSRHQVKQATFKHIAANFQERNPGTLRIYYSGGAEKAAIENIELDRQVRINAIPATADKFVRAQPASTAWNEGRILLPRRADWLDAFIDEVCSFTGVNDVHDDQVDALAAAHDEAAITGSIEYHTVESRRYTREERGWV